VNCLQMRMSTAKEIVKMWWILIVIVFFISGGVLLILHFFFRNDNNFGLQVSFICIFSFSSLMVLWKLCSLLTKVDECEQCLDGFDQCLVGLCEHSGGGSYVGGARDGGGGGGGPG